MGKTLVVTPMSVVPSWVDHFARAETFAPLPFQQELVDKLKDKKSRLIGDDMGLGKTVEGMLLDMEARKKEGARHKKLRVLSLNPKNRKQFEDELLKNNYDVFICHWEALRLMPNLGKVKFLHVIADECHRAKNRKAQQTRALKKIKTTYKTGMSGTPADNKPHDLWSILNWLWPSYYTSYWAFYKFYVKFEVGYPEGYHKIVGIQNIEKLQAEMKPWYMRRLKEDVLKDLPDKYYQDVYVELAPKQRAAYNKMKKDLIAWVGEHEDQPLVAPVVIAQLTRLQQFALAYASFNDEGRLIMTDPSSKLDALMEMIEDGPEDKQWVVFSQFKQVAYLLSQRLAAKQISHGTLTGDTKQGDRGALVEDFQSGRVRVFVGTIAAGGVGITLTAASTVVFLDRAWSPALNKQAEDRLHRYGQKNAVQVIDIMARNTVDLGRRQTIEQKWEWIRKILGDEDK